MHLEFFYLVFMHGVVFVFREDNIHVRPSNLLKMKIYENSGKYMTY